MPNHIVFWTKFDRRHRWNMKSRRKFFVKIIKITVKDNMGQTVLSFDLKTCFNPKTKLLPCFLTKILLKGYLCCKMITSQNMSSEAQVNKFLFRRKIMFCSQDIQVFVFLTSPWFTKSVMSWWVLVHEAGCIFWIYL